MSTSFHWDRLSLQQAVKLLGQDHWWWETYRSVFDELHALFFWSTSDTNFSSENLPQYHFKIILNNGQLLYTTMSRPQIKGGSLDINSLKFFNSFLDQLIKEPKGIYLLHLTSSGAKITESNLMLDHIWGVLPLLFKVRNKHFLMTIAAHRCLGAAALYFAQGTYRLVIGEATLLNLTGPGVIEKFYQQTDDIPYETYASAGHLWPQHDLIHHIFRDSGEFNQYFDQLLHALALLTVSVPIQAGAPLALLNQKPFNPIFSKSLGAMELLLFNLGESWIEVFPGFTPICKTFIVQRQGKKYGLFLQPPKNPYNSVDHDFIVRWKQAIKLFKSLELPILSAMDSPGGDPRRDQSDLNIILHTVELLEDVIFYPYPKAGLVLYRLYGGATLFAFPQTLGSPGCFVMPEAHLGIMSEKIINQLVPKSLAASEIASSESVRQEMFEQGSLAQEVSVNNLAPIFDYLFAGDELRVDQYHDRHRDSNLWV